MEIVFTSYIETKRETIKKFKGVKLTLFDQYLLCMARHIFKLWNFWYTQATKAGINKKWKWSVCVNWFLKQSYALFMQRSVYNDWKADWKVWRFRPSWKFKTNHIIKMSFDLVLQNTEIQSHSSIDEFLMHASLGHGTYTSSKTSSRYERLRRRKKATLQEKQQINSTNNSDVKCLKHTSFVLGTFSDIHSSSF